MSEEGKWHRDTNHWGGGGRYRLTTRAKIFLIKKKEERGDPEGKKKGKKGRGGGFERKLKGTKLLTVK